MLAQMSDRGPDSAGVAVYRDPVAVGMTKLTLYSPHAGEDWRAVAASVGGEVDSVRCEPRGDRRPRRGRRGRGPRAAPRATTCV